MKLTPLFLMALFVAQAQTAPILEAPTWSPDGKSVCYISNETGNTEIYIQHLETGETLKITDTPTAEWTPAWSPDGSKIAYISNRDGNKELYYYDLSSKSTIRVTDTPGDESMCSWSPDSKNLIHIYSEQEAPNKILQISLDGNSGNITPNSNCTYIYPSLSTDGTRLLYGTKPFEGEHSFHVAVLDLESNEETPLETMGFVSYNPSWGCNDTKIIFVNQENKDIATASVYMMDSDGSSVEKLVSCEGGCFQPRLNQCKKLLFRDGWRKDHKGIQLFDLDDRGQATLLGPDPNR